MGSKESTLTEMDHIPSVSSENVNSNDSNVTTTTNNLSTSLEINNGASNSEYIIDNETKYNDQNEKVECANKSNTQALDKFKKELRIKRLARQTAVQKLRDEISSLRIQLAAEQMLTRNLQKSVGNDTSTIPCETFSVDKSKDMDGACALAYDGVSGHTQTEIDLGCVIDTEKQGRQVNIELANLQLQLQMANSENISLRSELKAVEKQVGTLKEVINCCKQMLSIKEDQCMQLKIKLKDIEDTFAEREMDVMSDKLRMEYERQLGNIKQLRNLYEERQRVATAEHENLQRLISIKRDELLKEKEIVKTYEEHNQSLVKEIEIKNSDFDNLREDYNDSKLENNILKDEMNTINMLFSKMIKGFKGIDIDRLTMMLEENRGILNDIVTKEVLCGDNATLPKLLLDIFQQTLPHNDIDKRTVIQENENLEALQCGENDDKKEIIASAIAMKHNPEGTDKISSMKPTSSNCNTSHNLKSNNILKEMYLNNFQMEEIKKNMLSLGSSTVPIDVEDILKYNEEILSTEEIVCNLPKVWKVLVELLSHHTKSNQLKLDTNVNCTCVNNACDCNNSEQPLNGSNTEISVSKTYIKLKNLILEKNLLMKETNSLKTLNNHLEYRMNEQEKRLSAVSLELTKTWHLVGRMNRQHRQLHTQEQILRYQLQQKRRLVNELKEDLEHCRHKWMTARAKNEESQAHCNDLRREFAQRKLEDAIHNSSESGYSDETSASDEDTSLQMNKFTNSNEITSAITCNKNHYCFNKLFKHKRRVKRMQSTSPPRTTKIYGDDFAVIAHDVLRRNSAPPICKWCCNIGTTPQMTISTNKIVTSSSLENVRNSRMRRRRNCISKEDVHKAFYSANERGKNYEFIYRKEQRSCIQRLEDQCKSLIKEMLKTSNHRKQLETQLSRLQTEITPMRYESLIGDQFNIENNSRASSVPTYAGVLTPREEEYTRKRSERLERLEEESRQLLSRIKRTSDRGYYLGCSLDRIRRIPTQECSFDGASYECSEREETHLENECEDKQMTTNEEDQMKIVANNEGINNTLNINLTSNINDNVESEPTIEQRIESMNHISQNRDQRLLLLEKESEQLLTRLSDISQRGTQMINRIVQRELNSATSNTNEDEIAIIKTSEKEHRKPITGPKEPEIDNISCIVERELNATPTRKYDREYQGAIPKTSMATSINKSVKKTSNINLNTTVQSRLNPKENDAKMETLEEMVRRLQRLPFPQSKDERLNSNLNDQNNSK